MQRREAGSRDFSEFCGAEPRSQERGRGAIGRLDALPAEHGLQERLFAQVLELLQARGLSFRKGTIAGSAILAAPPSEKSLEKKRDQDVCRTKKDSTRHFGAAHIYEVPHEKMD